MAAVDALRARGIDVRDAEALARGTALLVVDDGDEDGDAELLVARTAAACRALIAHVSGLPGGVRAVIATRAGQSVRTGERVRVAAAAAWGLGRTFQIEQPQRDLVLVDVDADWDARRAAAALIDELAITDRAGEDQVALRAGARLAPRLAAEIGGEVVPAGAPGLALRADATYLVTGAFGSLGRSVCSWLADRGARRLVLVGCSVPPVAAGAGAAADVIRALTRRGVDVELVEGDVADGALVGGLFARLAAGDRPLRGIFHLAGRLCEGPLDATREEELRYVLRGKVGGAWLLHRHGGELPLDHFVVFGSIASWGGRHLGAYAAANEALHAIVALRAAAGLPAQCLSWGPWANSAMLSDQTAAMLPAIGVEAIGHAQGLRCLEHALASRERALTIGRFHWDVFAPYFEGGRTRGVLAVVPRARTTAAPAGAAALSERGCELAAVDPAARRRELVALLAARVGRV
ncbi:MAG TPA: KR domain-containing protein, partial [Kofleriaceae bacterium]|nr:KR domain-containing protein [Kofleriaceae bacterium]